MLRTNRNHHPLTVSLLMGLVTFAFCSFQNGRAPNFTSPVAAFPLMLAAIAFGFRGGLYSLLVGAVPIILIGSDVFGGLRLALIVSCIGLARSVEPRLPSYLFVMLAWAFIVMPLKAFFYPQGVYPPGALATRFWEHHILLGALTDILTSLVAGAFLLNPSFWTFITRRPYKANVFFLMTHVMALTSLLTVLAVVATCNRLGIFTQNRFADTNLWTAFGLLSTLVFIPSLIAFRLAFLTSRNAIDAIPPSLLTSLDSVDQDTNWDDSLPPEVSRQVKAPLEALGDDANRVGVCAIDENGLVIFINDQFRAASNIVLPGNVGRPFKDFAAQSPLVREITELLNSTPPERELVAECKISETSGSRRFFEVILRGRVEGDSAPHTPRVITVRDITERRSIERHLLEGQRMSTLSSYIHSSAKTLTDYCTAMVGKASCAQQSSDPSSWKDAVDFVNRTAKGAGRLASQLQEFVSNAPTKQRAVVDIGTLIKENLNLIEAAGGPSINIVIEAITPSLYANIDTQLIMHAITHLVENSKAAFESATGSIRINVFQEKIDQVVAHLHPGTMPGSFIRIRVTDTGCGMAPDILARATEPNFSTHATREHAGMGLSTVFAIMRDHDGFMTIESKPNAGTAVSLYIPETSAPALSQRVFDASAVGNETIRRGSGSVVVVEQQDDLREVLCDMVAALGYQVTGCRDTHEISTVLEHQSATILVLDEELPSSVTHSMLTALKNQHASLRTVLLVNSVRVPRDGSDGVLQKPFNLSKLSQALDAVAAKPPAPSTFASFEG